MSQPPAACCPTSLHCQPPPWGGGGTGPLKGETGAGAAGHESTCVPNSVPKRGQPGEPCLQSQPPPKRETPTTATACAFLGPQPSGWGASLNPSVNAFPGRCSPASWPLCLAGLGGDGEGHQVACPHPKTVQRILQLTWWGGRFNNISQKYWLSANRTLDQSQGQCWGGEEGVDASLSCNESFQRDTGKSSEL